MNLPLDFHPAVRDDVRRAFLWYEQQLSGLGTGFLDEVQRVVAQMSANPDRYGFAEGDVHVAPLKRFPFAVYYRILPNGLRVLAVLHSSRDPAAWKSRD